MSAISIPFFASFTKTLDRTGRAGKSACNASALQQLTGHYQRAAAEAERTGDRRAAYFKAHCDALARMADVR